MSLREGLGRMHGRRLSWLVLGALALLALGWWAGSRIRSPADVAAASAPPTPSVITAPVQYRRLSNSLILRGKVVTGGNESVPAFQPSGASLPVITSLSVRPGDRIQAGALLVTISGRPLFALRGRIPMYRDLTPGTQGPDVAQLQRALAQLGYAVPFDGIFAQATQSAVAALYRAHGVSAIGTGGTELAALSAAQQRVAKAARAVHKAVGSGQGWQLAAARKLSSARSTAQELAVHTGITVPMGEIAFLPHLPARVESIAGKVGAKVTPGKPLIRLTIGTPRVKTFLTRLDRRSVQKGDVVRIRSEVLRKGFRGRIASISDHIVERNGAPRGYRTRIQGRRPIKPKWAGQDVRVTIVAASTRQKVLVVPLAAISAGADGSERVIKVAPDGSRSVVIVRAGLSGDGFVAVTPLEGVLRKGDLVSVGR